MDSDLSLEFLRVVEQAAIACAHTMGQGDRHKSDQVAVEALPSRHELRPAPIVDETSVASSLRQPQIRVVDPEEQSMLGA